MNQTAILSATILAASIILRPAPPVYPEASTIVIQQETPVVNITHEPPAITIEPQAVVVNVPRSVPNQPVNVVVEPAPVLPPEIVYQTRDVERIVEVPSCLDYSNLPHFDLANALTKARPGAQWSLNGDHMNGLIWHDATTPPTMTEVIGGWLTALAEDC